ncbi:unnamed protein product, partial [Mesorhabditis spiculigera]
MAEEENRGDDEQKLRWTQHSSQQLALMAKLRSTGYAVFTTFIPAGVASPCLLDDEGIIVWAEPSPYHTLSERDIVISIGGCAEVSSSNITRRNAPRYLTIGRFQETTSTISEATDEFVPDDPQQPLIDVINNNTLIALLFSGYVCGVCVRSTKTLRPFHGIQLCAVHRNQISRKQPPGECVDFKTHGLLRLTHTQPSDCHACTAIIVRQLTGRGGS